MIVPLWKSEHPCWRSADDGTDSQEVRPSGGRRTSGNRAPRRWSLQKVEPLEIGISGGKVAKDRLSEDWIFKRYGFQKIGPLENSVPRGQGSQKAGPSGDLQGKQAFRIPDQKGIYIVFFLTQADKQLMSESKILRRLLHMQHLKHLCLCTCM